MPGFEVLYYPDFEPPLPWLRAFLLIFDKIRTVVPETIEPNTSDGVLEILEKVPGALERIPPQPTDTNPAAWNMTRLRAAFKHIQKAPNTKNDKIRLIVELDGRFSIEGHTFLHDTKMSYAVRNLLEECRLIQPNLKPIVDNLGMRGFSVVRHAAADLIVSLVADSIGRRNGWNTVTDRNTDFLVNSLNFVDRTSPKGAAVALASSIVQCLIPKQIADIDIRQYAEIREEYSELRGALARSVISMTEIKALETIQDVKILEERIQGLTNDLNMQVERVKRSAVGRSVKRWAPVGIGAIGSLAGIYAGHIGLGLVAGVGIGVGVEVLKKIVGIQEYESEERRIHRLLGKLQGDVMAAAELRWLS